MTLKVSLACQGEKMQLTWDYLRWARLLVLLWRLGFTMSSAKILFSLRQASAREVDYGSAVRWLD